MQTVLYKNQMLVVLYGFLYGDENSFIRVNSYLLILVQKERPSIGMITINLVVILEIFI